MCLGVKGSKASLSFLFHAAAHSIAKLRAMTQKSLSKYLGHAEGSLSPCTHSEQQLHRAQDKPLGLMQGQSSTRFSEF